MGEEPELDNPELEKIVKEVDVAVERLKKEQEDAEELMGVEDGEERK